MSILSSGSHRPWSSRFLIPDSPSSGSTRIPLAASEPPLVTLTRRPRGLRQFVKTVSRPNDEKNRLDRCHRHSGHSAQIVQHRSPTSAEARRLCRRKWWRGLGNSSDLCKEYAVAIGITESRRWMCLRHEAEALYESVPRVAIAEVPPGDRCLLGRDVDARAGRHANSIPGRHPLYPDHSRLMVVRDGQGHERAIETSGGLGCPPRPHPGPFSGGRRRRCPAASAGSRSTSR